METDDRQLILRYRQGDDEACRLLLASYERYVYSLCYRFAGNREDALDLAQEALIKVLLRLDGFQVNRPFKPWLRKVTVNTCLNALRRSYPETVSLNQPVGEDLALEDCLPDTGNDLSARLEWQDSREVLRDAVNRLPPHYRMVTILRHEEGMSYDEIAAATGLPLGTVKTCLFRARRQLRRKLSGIYGWEG
ncbi:MAG: sigma-70 family RNA polymerase sigma factor [Clostridia bacterium]|nr:sigma-70 family RNA polymerase sigma factor [Clostridia bacterium]MDQ7790747.1 sigma-70 family RNA polymerase sigma factor [Clostridia bacterium]